jgi:hypothetical protein
MPAALEGLLPGGQEAEGIESENLGGDSTDDQVAMVDGVERSAEEAYHALRGYQLSAISYQLSTGTPASHGVLVDS